MLIVSCPLLGGIWSLWKGGGGMGGVVGFTSVLRRVRMPPIKVALGYSPGKELSRGLVPTNLVSGVYIHIYIYLHTLCIYRVESVYDCP